MTVDPTLNQHQVAISGTDTKTAPPIRPLTGLSGAVFACDLALFNPAAASPEPDSTLRSCLTAIKNAILFDIRLNHNHVYGLFFYRLTGHDGGTQWQVSEVMPFGQLSLSQLDQLDVGIQDPRSFIQAAEANLQPLSDENFHDYMKRRADSGVFVISSQSTATIRNWTSPRHESDAETGRTTLPNISCYPFTYTYASDPKSSPKTMNEFDDWEQLAGRLQDRMPNLHPNKGKWTIREDLSMNIVWYRTVRSTKPIAAEYVADSELALHQTKKSLEYIEKSTGTEVAKNQVARCYDFGLKKLIVEPEAMVVLTGDLSHRFRVCGFLPRDSFDMTRRVGDPVYIVPSLKCPESNRLFRAFHRQMTQLNRLAVGYQMGLHTRWPKLVVYLAEPAEPESSDHWGHPSHITVLPIASSDETRAHPLETSQRDKYKQLNLGDTPDKFGTIIDALKSPGPYTPNQTEDPCLATHYERFLNIARGQPGSPTDFYSPLLPTPGALGSVQGEVESIMASLSTLRDAKRKHA
ncbi:hypothetical protein H4R33_006664 [Dimargaris cristalligena]|nr:hypothetical protein H4R33_006664 [Dimargaris cristalligena]